MDVSLCRASLNACQVVPVSFLKGQLGSDLVLIKKQDYSGYPIDMTLSPASGIGRLLALETEHSIVRATELQEFLASA